MPSNLYGLVARYETPAKLMDACEALKNAGYQKFDAHTPFPVHGLEKAMGVPPSKLPWISLLGGIAGGTGAITLQVWVHSFAYPQNIAGKPYLALPAYVPITFELTVLLCAFGTFFGLWGLCKLPQFFHPVMQAKSFPRCTDDQFIVAVEAADPKFDPEATRALLSEHGGLDIEEVAP